MYLCSINMHFSLEWYQPHDENKAISLYADRHLFRSQQKALNYDWNRTTTACESSMLMRCKFQTVI